jgi:hypothetical protein
MAAQAAKEKLIEAVAEKMEVNVEELEAKNRRIYVRGNPTCTCARHHQCRL